MRVERILAPNPGLFTGPGTNTYVLVSHDECLIVDPGPPIPSHRDAILGTVASLQPRGVLVTHTHPDHAPLANPIAGALDIPAYGYSSGPDFEPDRTVRNGDRIPVGTTEVRVVHTPGHSDDHLCFVARDALFSGDHIMGGSTVVVEDMAAYLESLRRLSEERLEVIYPGHGDQSENAAEVIGSYIEHRLMRERQVLAAVEGGAPTVGAIVGEVYADVDVGLHPLAALSVLAHARKLQTEGRLSLTEAAVPWEAMTSPARQAEEGPLGG